MSVLKRDGTPGQSPTAITCGPGLTRQSMKDETDINRIVARYRQTGFLSYVNAMTPSYVNISDVNDYRDALEQMRKTDTFFEGLPAKVRARFENNPVVFLDFIVDPANEAEAITLGLAKAPVAPVDAVAGLGVQGRDPATGKFTSP